MKMLTGVSDIEKAPEIMLYFWMETLGDFLWTMRRAVTHYEANPIDLSVDVANAKADQEEIYGIVTERFGFADKDEYFRWYRWWNKWHKGDLTDGQWEAVSKRLAWDGTQTEETFADLRPEGNWRQDAVSEYTKIDLGIPNVEVTVTKEGEE